MANISNEKYQSKLKQDAGVIILLLALLYFSEIYMIYNILSIISTAFNITSLMPLYIIFIVLLLGIETIGCVRVYQSIKKHMFEYEYYD